MSYLKKIFFLKEKFKHRFGFEPTHLIINDDEYEQVELEILDSLVLIKDTTAKTVGTKVMGMDLIVAKDVKGIMVGKLYNEDNL